MISAQNGGLAELQYYNQADMGAVSYTGVYQMLFFSFGFEAIASGDSRWRDRDSALADILNYFNFGLPGGSPTILEVSVSPGDPFHMTDHTPDISWTYFDPEMAPQEMYQIQVGADNDWSLAEMWDSGPIPGAASMATYAGLQLFDGESYYYRVRAFDGALWSNWYQDGFRMNSLPSQIAGLSPDHEQCVDSVLPELSHDNSADQEYDNLTYAYRVYDDAGLTNLIAQADGHPEQLGTTTWQIDILLSDNSTYYWRVRANDGFEDGPWSHTAIFIVNSVNQAPNAFALIAPDSGQNISDVMPSFIWQAAIDPDPCDSVRYSLYYDNDSIFTDPTIVGELDTTAYTPAEPLPGGRYYWKVVAGDLFGGSTVCNSVFIFTLGEGGDANGDGLVDVGDAVFLINYIFRSGPPPDPHYLGDANCDGNVDVGDAVFLINYIFREGPPPGC
jgi:hypothetical protein